MGVIPEGLHHVEHVSVQHGVGQDSKIGTKRYLSLKTSNWLLSGSYPWISKKATSKKDDFSANCSMGIPLYSKIPLSPSMYEILDVEQMVFMYPGS